VVLAYAVSVNRCALKYGIRARAIPENKLQVIFEEFQALDRPPYHGGEGLGLGLAIADGCARVLGPRNCGAFLAGQSAAVFPAWTVPLARQKTADRAPRRWGRSALM